MALCLLDESDREPASYAGIARAFERLFTAEHADAAAVRQDLATFDALLARCAVDSA